MFSAIALALVLASGVSAPAAATTTAADLRPQKILQTIRAANDGTTTVERHSVDAAATTLRSVGPDGRVVEATWGPEKRVLIEIREHPKLHRTLPGSAAVALLQRQQLERDLRSLDARLHTRTPSRITRQYDTLFSGVAATVDSAAIAEIRRLPNVVAVHDDAEVRASLTESVPLIGATAVAGTYGVTGAGVRVAVIDTGIDYTHPDLGGCLGAACKVIDGYDFVNDDADPRDDHGHGTHVAGIVAANGTLKGVAPGATLLAYKVLDSNGNGSMSDIIAGLEQALLDGAKVANLSLGGPGNPGDPTSQALDNATAAGMLSVVAAGNSGPNYQTVGSPGVARTALTVGATDKSWQMSYFSSRGYVTDGEQLVMKPEVVAPGVDIRSTVPTTGLLGDPSGYKALNGTSMATPHVAGSAALLLQWNGTQTPAELKNRLASTARPIDGDVFMRGVGGIDLVAAFGVRSFPTTTHVPFGIVDQSSGIIVREQTLTLRNTGSIAETLTLAMDAPLPPGATLEIVPSSATLAPGTSVNITLRLHVDAAVVPEAAEPLVWSTNIAITGGAQAARVPAYFFKGSRLTLSFDEPPYSVYLNSETGNVRTFFGVGTSLSVLLKSGLWDVMTTYIQSPSPVIVVVHEQQNVQQTLLLNINRAQATRNVTLRAVDDAEQPLSAGMFSKDLELRVAGFVMGIGGPDDYRVSELSSRFAVGIGGSGPDPSGQRFFASSWAGEGLTSDVILPTPGAPFRRLTQPVMPPAGPPATLVFFTGFAIKTQWGGLAWASGYIWPGVQGRTWYLQSTAAPDLPIRPIVKTALMDESNFALVIDGPYLHQKNPVDIEVSPGAFFDLMDPSLEPDALLGPAVERWDLDTAPNALPLPLWTSPSAINASGVGLTSWMTHTVSMIERVSGAQPVFDLYRNGALAGTYTIASLNAGISTLPGAHELHATSEYTINGVSGSSKAVISFDTNKPDSNPPFVTRFSHRAEWRANANAGLSRRHGHPESEVPRPR